MFPPGLLRLRLVAWVCFAGLALRGAPGCAPPAAVDSDRLKMLDTVTVKIGDKDFVSWVADDDAERRVGLMHVPADELHPTDDGRYRGMLFVFPSDQPTYNGFWMKDTIAPLDIAFIRGDGTVVTIRTMAPLDIRSTYATAPYRYALEVSANLFKQLKIKEGDTATIPQSVLNNVE